MKRFVPLALLFSLLCGCSGGDAELNQAISLRQELLRSSGCHFQTEITADYGDKMYTFSMDCDMDAQGKVTFTVTKPESLAGISGTVSDVGGNLMFADTELAFPLLADEQLSPVSGPWILMKTLRSGYFRAAGIEDGLLCVTIDDSYQEDAMQLDIWIAEENTPVRAEILHNGSRILSLAVSNFQIL